MFLFFLIKKSLIVIKNKYRAPEIIVKLIRKFTSKFFTIKNDLKIEKNYTKIKFNLLSKFDLIHLSLGPIAINIKNGTKKGIISL